MMDFSSNSRSSSISDLSVDFPNNPNDDFIDETEVIDMDVDGVVDISERSFPEVSSDYCERFVGIVVTVSVDSDSDHEGDVASLSSFSESECDSIALTSEFPEENDEFVEDNFAEVDLDDELANGLEEYEELEENQDELTNPVENEDQIDELASTLEEEQIVENLFEVASNHSVLEGSDNGHDSVTDLLASPFKYSSEEEGWIEASDDDDAEYMVEDVDEVIFVDAFRYSTEDEGWIEASDDDDAEDIVEDVDEVILVDDDEIMVDLVSNSNSQDVEENVNFLPVAVLPAVSVASSESSTQRVLVDHLEASELSGNREQFLQSVPVATAASDSAPSLTPSEEFNFRISIERTRLREMEREAAELQARVDEQEVAAEQLDEQEVAAEQLDEQEVAAEQHTGYGIVEGNLDYILDFEGVLPKLPLFSLISNWLSNAENNFNLFI